METPMVAFPPPRRRRPPAACLALALPLALGCGTSAQAVDHADGRWLTVESNATPIFDAQGNVTPSVFHQWPYGDPPRERCGFHTQPTKLLDFVDIR